MPVYMDRHYIEGATRHAVADAHHKDLALQNKYDVKFLTYWFDEIRSTAFCILNPRALKRTPDWAKPIVAAALKLG